MKNYVLLILLSFVCLIIQAKEIPGIHPTHQTVYVSSSMGDDENNGQSLQSPLKTIKKALSIGDTIYLKAGDIFYEGGVCMYGKYLSRYGEGVNPTICGYKRIVEPLWIEIEKNIWILSLVEDNFTGVVLEGPSTSNNICAFHDYENDMIHGRKVWHKTELTNDWDFWQTEILSKANPEEYNDIYLYLTTSPNLLKLEMSIYDCAMNVDHSTIDGVNFIGYGFGIGAHSNTIIRNCKIDAIGGRIIPEGESYNCYGNGIEFYVGGDKDLTDCIVENCYISRCYDCGITIQGKGGTTATPRNIIIQNNMITNCCQGWEDFLRNNDDVCFDNCVFKNNIVLRSGNTSGFGYQASRFKYCHILGNNVAGDRGMRIENNIFAQGNFYCSGAYNNAYRSNIWKDNRCFLSEDDFILGDYFGKSDVLRMRGSKRRSQPEIKKYRALTGDLSTEFVIMSRRRVNAKANKLEKQFLRSHIF